MGILHSSLVSELSHVLSMRQDLMCISIPIDLRKKLEEIRGDIPRSKFIQRLIEKELLSREK